jgi:polysaccharide biosynthesis transport protein
MSISFNTRDWQMWRQLLLRRRNYLIVSILLALAVGLFYAFTAAPVYESSSTVMIVDADLLSGAQLRFVPGVPQQDEVEYFRRRITSEVFLHQLIDSLNLEQNAKLAAKIAQVCQENPLIDRKVVAQQLQVEHLLTRINTRMRSSNLLEISAKGPTSESAFHLASLVTNLAIAETQKSEIQTVSAASSFSSQQLEIYRKRLEDSESRLASFNQGIMDTDLSDTQLSPEKLAEVQSVKLSTEIDLQAKRDQMQKLTNGPLRGVSLAYQSQLDRDIHDLRQRMLKRTEDVCELLKKFSWRDIEIIQLNEELGQLKRDIYDRIRSSLAAYYSDQPSEVANAAIRMEEMRLDTFLLQRTSELLQNSIQSHNNQIRRQPSRDGLRTKLERDVLINREIYEMLLQTSRGTQMRESAEVKESQMKFKLLAAPQQPLERIKPKRKQVMMFALIIGLGLGLGLVLVRETLDVTVRNVDDVSRFLKMPVLAAIPKIETSLDKTRRKYRRLAAAVAIPLLAFVSVMLVYRILIH